MHVFRNAKLADNAMGFTHASGAYGRYAFTSRVVDSLFVGETDNIGNPRTDAEKAYGRSVPKPALPDYPIHGYEFYDYRHDVVNDTFVNFQDNATRKSGAVTYLYFTSFGVSSNNSVAHLKFVNAKPVYFPPMESKWANDNFTSTAYKTAVIRDLDGSFGGGPNSYVLINDGVNDSIAADAQDCVVKPTWNAAVCRGDIGRLSFGRPPRVAGPRPGPGAAPARAGGGGFGPPPKPDVVLSRNGKDYSLIGTNVRAGTEIKVTTERPSLDINLSELNKGSWVIFQLPGFTTAASGQQEDSLDALRKAGETSYFKDSDALWVKVVANGVGANAPYGGGPEPAGPGLDGPGFGGANTVKVSR